MSKDEFKTKDLSNLKDHDILLQLYSDVCWVKKILGNHLKHHWLITLAAIGTAMTAGGALLVKFLMEMK